MSVLITAAIACAFSGGDGTAANPYQISTREHLEAVNDNLAAHYILINDIDLEGITYSQAVIAPDTSTSDFFQGIKFTGLFNGEGFKISNLTINSATIDYIGLFGYVDSGASITNLGIEDCNISGKIKIGGLIGHNCASITDCYVSGNVSGSGDNIGGLIGTNDGGTVANSYYWGYITGGGIVGGLVGWNSNSGKIYKSYANMVLTGNHSIGGLVGYNGGWDCSGIIINSYAQGNIDGEGSYIGGLVGQNRRGIISCSYAEVNISSLTGTQLGGLTGGNLYGEISDSYSWGSVTGRYGIGGLAGLLAEGKIIKCYSTGMLFGYWGNMGGMIGSLSAGSYEDTGNFWDTQTSGQSVSAVGIGKTTTLMKTQATFTNAGWDFVNEADNGLMDLWYMPESGYPRLYWQADNGDINYDVAVDDEDILALAAQWLSMPQEGQRLAADINVDGAVDLLDYGFLAAQWLIMN